LAAVDDGVAPLMLPFPFRFYGIQTDSAWLSSNGVIGFEEPTVNFDNECAGGGMRSAIMPFWDDLATRERGVCVATFGSAPNRQFVVTWNDAFVLGVPATHLTFSVVLNEGSDVIDVLYGSVSGGPLSAGQGATIGLANAGEYALDCCDQPCVSTNTGRRYVPVLL
jgi:hypothetical protein